MLVRILVFFCLFFSTSLFAQKDQIELVGKVLDKETSLPIEANIHYVRIPDYDVHGIYRCNDKDGKFDLVIGGKGTFVIEVQAEGYLSYLDTVSFDAASGKHFYVYLEPYGVGQVFHLNKLLFDQGSYEIKANSYEELEVLVYLMTIHPEMVIRVEGHTDYKGSVSSNLELSEQRVEAVKAYMVSKGIKKNRIKTKSFGGTKPLIRSEDNDKRAVNRRVDVIVLKR